MKLLKRDGVRLPDVLRTLTPHQFVVLYTSPERAEGTPGDWRVESLQKSNDELGRRGLPPVFPSWL